MASRTTYSSEYKSQVHNNSGITSGVYEANNDIIRPSTMYITWPACRQNQPMALQLNDLILLADELILIGQNWTRE